MDEITRNWIDVAKVLAADPAAKVQCHLCHVGYFQIIDVPIDEHYWDRYIFCDHCREYVSITKMSNS
ncbi:hypothetical protein [Chitinophaga sp. Cy-1792]|uniref:hypothetical protein n=1 Tax=Chitinophaga sp. Cy-1792 TaxID=2608339 RepID=UPI001423E8A6|nr:hypothetical protein [Chitinophaga sp. Cy-1792]NIG56644.1 hypothetical protein [Chitinophaga sp. Cy-1792]